MLYTHYNPLILERSNDIKRRNKAVGIDHQLFDLTEKLLDFCQQEDPNSPFMAVIKGEAGSGKTLFALNLLDEIANSSEFRMLNERQGKLPIYSSSLNAESELKFLNIWRPVLQMMLL
jgi:pantothenate kinase-related protein Tda10